MIHKSMVWSLPEDSELKTRMIAFYCKLWDEIASDHPGISGNGSYIKRENDGFLIFLHIFSKNVVFTLESDKDDDEFSAVAIDVHKRIYDAEKAMQ